MPIDLLSAAQHFLMIVLAIIIIFSIIGGMVYLIMEFAKFMEK